MELPDPAVEPLTLAECYKQCSIDPEGSPPSFVGDALLEIYISTARAWAELYTGVALGQRAVSETLSAFPADGGAITLPGWPVLGLQSITYVNELGDEIEVDPALYEIDTTTTPREVILTPDSEWPDDVGDVNYPVVVNYFVGYSAPGESPQSLPMPKHIKGALLMIVAHLWKNRENESAVALQTVPLGARQILNTIKVRRPFA